MNSTGDPKVLGEIVAEEGANVGANFVFPHVSLLKLKNLPKLTAFYAEIHTSEWPILKEMEVINCDKFTSNLISEPKSIFFDNKNNSDSQKMELKDKNRWIEWQSQYKVLKIWHDVSADIPFEFLQRFENLKQLQLFFCDQYKEIKCLSDLPNLEVLDVSCCDALMSLVPSSASFCKLEVLNVSVCNGLVTKLITPLMARSLVQLREMSICECGRLIEIVENEGDARTIEIDFENLKKLSLTYLKSLTYFCSGNYSFNFPSLEDLIIWNCPNMKTFSNGSLSTPKLRKIDYQMEETDLENGGSDLNTTIQQAHTKKDSNLEESTVKLTETNIESIRQREFQENSIVQYLDVLKVQYGHNLTILLPSLASFKNLRTLRVRYCNGMQKLMSTSTAKSLVRLEFLSIGECEKMIEVLENGGYIEEGEIVFEKLKELYLYNLKSLTCFCSEEYTLKFPFLERLYVSVCSKMETFSGGALSMPRLQELNWRDCSKSDFYTITPQSQNIYGQFPMSCIDRTCTLPLVLRNPCKLIEGAANSGADSLDEIAKLFPNLLAMIDEISAK